MATAAETALAAAARRGWRRDVAVGLLVAATMLVWVALVATQGSGRWPWAGFVLAAVAPYFLLPVPVVTARLRAWLEGQPRRAAIVLAGLSAYAAVLLWASGQSRWPYILLVPACLAAAGLAAGVGRSGGPSAARTLLVGLPIWILAGVWDARLQVRVPGGIDIGLAYLVAVDAALFLLLVARPLRSLDAGLALTWRQVATALVAVLALLVAALPLGYLIGFLRFNVRWTGPADAFGRLIGLALFVGVPEELLFRGIVQDALCRLWGARRGWIAASLLFGLTHIVKHMPPLNWRYALLAGIAGLAYGWVYQRTGRLGAAALTHGLVDWLWGTFLMVG